MVLVARLKPIPIRYQTFPRTVNPPEFAEKVAKIFRDHEQQISTTILKKGLTSDEVLRVIRGNLENWGLNAKKVRWQAAR
jgi:hypothetical protein